METTSFKSAVFAAAAAAVADVKTHGMGGSPHTSYTPRHFSAVTRQHDRNKGQGKKRTDAGREHVWVEGGREGREVGVEGRRVKKTEKEPEPCARS